jgi:hypothetical protein
MDCKTARLLLPFLNPRAEQLPAELAEALEAHANQCAACTLVLQNTGREDRLIAVAMKGVEIPEGLRGRLVAGLRRERARRRRTWPVRHPRWSAAAAVLLLCIGGAFGYWWQKPLPPVDIAALAGISSLEGYEQVRLLLAERGRREAPPGQFRYNLLISCGWERLQGKLVPRLVFEGNAGQVAEVFILNSKEFDLDATSSESSGGNANFEFRRYPNNNPEAYLVKYTGGPVDWLFVKEPNGT